MFTSKKLYGFLLLLGDAAVFYLGLFLALALRYQSLPGQAFWRKMWGIHKIPFLYVHFLWILIFYIIGLYDFRALASRKIIYDYVRNNGFSKREKDVFFLLLEGRTMREVEKCLGISHVMVIKYKKKVTRELKILL